MPLIDDAPHVRLLIRMEAVLRAVDFGEEAGVADLTVRQFRNRFSTAAERPCLALRWVGNDYESAGGEYRNADEMQKRCDVDLYIDLKPPTETSGDDPTGWSRHSRVAAVALRALRDPTRGYVGTTCDWVTDGAEAPFDDSKPDDGRLVKSISVVYRVLTDDPNRLLAAGENG